MTSEPEAKNLAGGNAPAADSGPAAKAALQSQRLLSLDAYRGLIMISLAFGGFGLARTARAFLKANPDSWFWEAVRYQFSHVEWVGCGYWDLIQPSFMFMVGVSMAYSYAKRAKLGDSYRSMLGHAFSRAGILILLSWFLMSKSQTETNWTLTNVLGQIGLGYGFLFLLWNRSVRTQAIAAAGILLGTWLLYVVWPGSGLGPEGRPEFGIGEAWLAEHLKGVSASWHKSANAGQAVDLRLLNLFPRTEPYTFNGGGYHSINFIPSIATMLFGLMCGELLRSQRDEREKLKLLLIAGATGLIAGQFLNLTGICPLVVVGSNSIAIYCMSMTLKPFTAKQWQIHFGQDVFTLWGALGEAWAPCVQSCLVGTAFWAVCWYLYRNRIFIRI